VRRLGNVQRYTVQCVLPINLFNEKIYLFLWFWMVFVAAITCFSLLTWAMRSAFRSDRHRYVKKHLRLMDKLERDTDKEKVGAANFLSLAVSLSLSLFLSLSLKDLVKSKSLSLSLAVSL
jgi:hypothetical protein